MFKWLIKGNKAKEDIPLKKGYTYNPPPARVLPPPPPPVPPRRSAK